MKSRTISGDSTAIEAKKEALRDELGVVLYSMAAANPEMAELEKVAAAELDSIAVHLGVKQKEDLAALAEAEAAEAAATRLHADPSLGDAVEVPPNCPNLEVMPHEVSFGAHLASRGPGELVRLFRWLWDSFVNACIRHPPDRVAL